MKLEPVAEASLCLHEQTVASWLDRVGVHGDQVHQPIVVQERWD